LKPTKIRSKKLKSWDELLNCPFRLLKRPMFFANQKRRWDHRSPRSSKFFLPLTIGVDGDWSPVHWD
jgi:hypothetical protein